MILKNLLDVVLYVDIIAVIINIVVIFSNKNALSYIGIEFDPDMLIFELKVEKTDQNEIKYLLNHVGTFPGFDRYLKVVEIENMQNYVMMQKLQ